MLSDAACSEVTETKDAYTQCVEVELLDDDDLFLFLAASKLDSSLWYGWKISPIVFVPGVLVSRTLTAPRIPERAGLSP